MPREITVVTPENIPLTLTLAGLSSRFGALLIDLLVQSLVSLILLFGGIGILAALGRGWEDFASALAGWMIALGIVALFVIWFGYFIFFETVWNGQTPGKRVFGLRVIRDGGYPVNVFSVVTRNLIRLADFLPLNYGIGAVAVFFHPEYKRLGDMAAGTLVIRERERGSLMVKQAPVDHTVVPLPPGMFHPSEVLTPEEQGLLRRFASRRWDLHPDDAERLGYRIMAPLVARLNITFAPGAPPRYADLIVTLVAAMDARDEEKLR